MTLTTLLIIIHVLVCFFLIGIVLLQHGKGADIGATFGGSSQSLFGSEGPVPLLNKITTFSAIVFMGTSVTLAYLSAHKSGGSVMTDMPAQEAVAPEQKEELVTIPMPTTEQPPAPKTEEKVAEPAATEQSPAAQSEPSEAAASADTPASVQEQTQVQVQEEKPPVVEKTSEPELSAAQQNASEAPTESKSATE